QWEFITDDFSHGLRNWEDNEFDGVVSGLAIQYAESYSDAEQRWTCDAYDHVLAETFRVLRPGGVFIFSVNVPNPAWWRVAFSSLFSSAMLNNPIEFCRRSLRMWKYGKWLTNESRRGRFQYLPLSVVQEKLEDVGFTGVEHRRSYAGQAFVIRCVKP